jgi:uncharacterized protein
MNTLHSLSSEEYRSLILQQLHKSNQALDDARLLIDNQRFDAALNRLYYSLFYAMNAVAISHNFGTSKHLQLIGWFNKTILHPGLLDPRLSKLISKAYRNRREADYDDNTEFLLEEMETLFTEITNALPMVHAFAQQHLP